MGGVFLTSFRMSLALKEPSFGTRTSHRFCRQSKERITRTPNRVTQYSSRIERLFPICDHLHPSFFCCTAWSAQHNFRANSCRVFTSRSEFWQLFARTALHLNLRLNVKHTSIEIGSHTPT